MNDTIVLQNRLDALNKRKNYLLSIKKQFRTESINSVDIRISNIKKWLKQLKK